MTNLKRVVWSKGMFLSPQHFQAQDDFFEDVLQFRATASSNCNWGVTELAVDHESLSNGQFSLRNCRGILPEGLPFQIPDCDEPPPTRDIAQCFPPTGQDLDVYLALPERRTRGRNVTLAPGEGSTRYLAETRNVVDQTSGYEEKPVQVCAKNFRIVFGSESLDGKSSIRIAQITLSATGAYVLRDEFVPPALSLEAGEQLLLLARRLIEVLTGKASSLAAQRRQKGRSQAEFGSADIGAFWLLHTINSYLPGLKHFWKQRRRHPEQLYVTMLELAGALTTFALGEDSRQLPDYDHDNLGGCFRALDEKIRQLLETAIPSRCVVIPLQLQEKSTWTGSITDPQLFRQTQFVIGVGAHMGIDDLIKQVPKLVKVSPTGELKRLVRNALPGIALRHLPVPPDGIPVKLDRQYFALNQSGVLWEGLSTAQQVSVFVPEEISTPDFELLVLKQA
jgi:type VI secretion system protein ImpJ